MQRAMAEPLVIADDEPFRVAPHNLDAEQAFLGAMLIDNGVLDDAPLLAPTHFFDPIHQRIFDAALTKVRAGQSASPISLADSFHADAMGEGDMTVREYLRALPSRAPTIRGAKGYAQTIIDLATRRQLILIGEDLSAAAFDASVDCAPAVLIEEAEQNLFTAARTSSASEVATTLSFGEAATIALNNAHEAYKGGKVGLKTGLVDLDRQLGGLHNTDLVILAGRPSMGKTALATNIAFYVAANQTPVHFFSLEMSADQLASRVLAEQIKVSASRLRSGNTQEKDIKAMMKAVEQNANVSLYIDQLGGASIAQVATRARRMKRQKGTGLIVIDYLQLMQASQMRRNSNRVQDITEITTGLKALAKELEVPILALSQLSRETEKRENKKPQLSDLRESGSIEQDADVVMFVFREEYYVEREKPDEGSSEFGAWQDKMMGVRGKADIIIGKQRHGELGTVSVAFNGELTAFGNLARQEVRHGL